MTARSTSRRLTGPCTSCTSTDRGAADVVAAPHRRVPAALQHAAAHGRRGPTSPLPHPARPVRPESAGPARPPNRTGPSRQEKGNNRPCPFDNLTEKYTGQHITDAELNAARDAGGLTAELASMLRTTAHSLRSTEQQLVQVASSLEETTANIRDNLNAAAGQPTRHLNSMGELLSTGVRTDLLIAQRADRIEHLRALV